MKTSYAFIDQCYSGNTMIRKIIRFFDKLEDRTRIYLSHHPILYSCIGAVGIVLVWKGVWETAEYFPILFGPGSILLGLLILLITGLLVSFFIGDNIILSGFKKEKKLAEKTEAEVVAEANVMREIVSELHAIEDDIEDIKEEQKKQRS